MNAREDVLVVTDGLWCVTRFHSIIRLGIKSPRAVVVTIPTCNSPLVIQWTGGNDLFLSLISLIHHGLRASKGISCVPSENQKGVNSLHIENQKSVNYMYVPLENQKGANSVPLENTKGVNYLPI